MYVIDIMNALPLFSTFSSTPSTHQNWNRHNPDPKATWLDAHLWTCPWSVFSYRPPAYECRILFFSKSTSSASFQSIFACMFSGIAWSISSLNQNALLSQLDYGSFSGTRFPSPPLSFRERSFLRVWLLFGRNMGRDDNIYSWWREKVKALPLWRARVGRGRCWRDGVCWTKITVEGTKTWKDINSTIWRRKVYQMEC